MSSMEGPTVAPRPRTTSDCASVREVGEEAVLEFELHEVARDGGD
jgi:hypothetical protein